MDSSNNRQLYVPPVIDTGVGGNSIQLIPVIQVFLYRVRQVYSSATRMLKAYAKEDLPPNRVNPVPVPVIRHILVIAHAGSDCVADMICLALFFLLRPGEYAINTSESIPFELKDV